MQQRALKVMHDNLVVGEYYADLLVGDCVLVELKTVKALDQAHIAQCLNYLKATGYNICLLLNFYKPRLEVKRVVNRFPDTTHFHSK